MVANSFIEFLKAANIHIHKTDLANDGWNDVLSASDFTEISDPIHINFRTEQLVSPLIPKIQEEQEKFLESDLFLLFTPLSWFGPPSHFFAWWERVVTFGKFYSSTMLYQTGAFSGKSALCVVVTDKKQEQFAPNSMMGSIEEILYPVTHGMLYPLGFKVYRSQCLFINAPEMYDEVIDKWKIILRELNERLTIQFNQPNDYTNWILNTPEKDRNNDMEILKKEGDLSLNEAVIKIAAKIE
ncbi:NAD(P)H-dependent oxidoreductase [Histomonas meleagridis]|uniref:NAD(P)H-dependent oxidoreductase n=1 Tax=Histomonas meleagridis TaxID=135588 RepID=UPI003559F72E|nr:NAD(P)H-dependent oxidoreductase [Histomonas meleagridis]KAH0804159.1 NAD(P)H-dependent oxidoreductase [Histomonas meleagridis]